jgi:hypothetical protein
MAKIFFTISILKKKKFYFLIKNLNFFNIILKRKNLIKKIIILFDQLFFL